jgi:hypothetical protein
MTLTIQQAAERVADARINYQDLADIYASHKRAFDEQWAELAGYVADAKADLQAAEDELRTAGLAHYAANPDSKKLPCGLGVRVASALRYEPKLALDWAVSHNMCLALDKKAFETVAKATAIDFVETVESVTVTLPSDTGKLLSA